MQRTQHFGGRILLDELFQKDIEDYSTCDPTVNVLGRKPPYKPDLVPQIKLKPPEPEKDMKRPVVNGYGVKFPPSVLSVVADSAEVEVLIIDRV